MPVTYYITGKSYYSVTKVLQTNPLHKKHGHFINESKTRRKIEQRLPGCRSGHSTIIHRSGVPCAFLKFRVMELDDANGVDTVFVRFEFSHILSFQAYMSAIVMDFKFCSLMLHFSRDVRITF